VMVGSSDGVTVIEGPPIPYKLRAT
jgi:hypothetical protein